MLQKLWPLFFVYVLVFFVIVVMGRLISVFCRVVSEPVGLGVELLFVCWKKSVIDFCVVVGVVVVVFGIVNVVAVLGGVGVIGLKMWLGSARLSPIL